MRMKGIKASEHRDTKVGVTKYVDCIVPRKLFALKWPRSKDRGLPVL